MKVTPILCGALLMTAPLYLNSCAVVEQVRNVDMSSIPGLSIIADAQQGMMDSYAQSTKLLMRSNRAALDALILDAQAYADAKKAGEEYDKAVSIRKRGEEMLREIDEQQQNLANKPDLDTMKKAHEMTEDVVALHREFNEMKAASAAGTNAQIASQNAKGDKLVMAAVDHVQGANVKIAESYELLQEAQMAECALVATAGVQAVQLIKAMESASPLQKAALAISFRPMVYFLTGLPGELDKQDEIKAMWEEHAKQVAGLTLPAAKTRPDVKSTITSVAPQLVKSFASFSF